MLSKKNNNHNIEHPALATRAGNFKSLLFSSALATHCHIVLTSFLFPWHLSQIYRPHSKKSRHLEIFSGALSNV